MSTRAVVAWCLEGYSVDSFLIGHCAHTSIYGSPTSVTTDQGSQLVAAAKGESYANWNAIQHTMAKLGTTWNFVPLGTP